MHLAVYQPHSRVFSYHITSLHVHFQFKLNHLRFQNNSLVHFTIQSRDEHASSLQSHPACRGPTFDRHAFNVHGQSPLVAQFLAEKHLSPQTGCDVIVQRTEIAQLPSYPSPHAITARPDFYSIPYHKSPRFCFRLPS